MAYGPKTRPTKASVAAFLEKIPDAGRRKDCKAVAAMMRKASGAAPKMWGPAIIGFGISRLRYASGKELDWPAIAFAPRKTDLTIYFDHEKDYTGLLAKLGRHKVGKCCLYIKRLADVDRGVLEALIEKSITPGDGGSSRPSGTGRRHQARPGADRR